MKIDIKALALSVGIVWGFAIFLLTIVVLIMDYGFLSGLDGTFLGYSISWIGAFVGFIYGFVEGLIFGALLGFFYNKFAK
ncbi:MAG: hypothetical protein V3S42_00390 [Candidatus Neomarinimicrobiota bacterium]